MTLFNQQLCLLIIVNLLISILSFKFSINPLLKSTSFILNLGSVALVGAGPGDPDLLTIKAYNCLKSASLVIADRLIAPEILNLIECELKVANKRPGCAEEAQEEIYQWVKEAVLQNKNVVRLKIGDPFLFGRAGEEILEYRRLGIEPTVIPGISSSYAAPLLANIPLTHRDVADQVLITTGYGKNNSIIEVSTYQQGRTLVLLMAVGRLNEIMIELVKKGYPSTLPVGIIENASTPRQRVMKGTIHSIVEIAKKNEAKPPAIVIVGDVVNVL